MYKIGICGHYGKHKNKYNGQTIKTKVLTNSLKKVKGKDSVFTIDTSNWKTNPIGLFIKCLILIIKCNEIIILPAQKGVRVFIPLFQILNKLFNKKLHYVVIGGWLPELITTNKRLESQMSKLDNIFVETQSMVKVLEKRGFKNIKYLPNFKPLDILKENELTTLDTFPFKLCTFSRVSKEKGIEDAVEAVIRANKSLGFIAYTLDIYGQVDELYLERFNKLKESFPEFITYKGVVNYKESIGILKKYFSLLFPTYYSGEGFPGTVIDAFAAGIPVIATDWKYNAEIIQHESDGLIYSHKKPHELKGILIELVNKPYYLNNMKVNCLKRAKDYTPEKVLPILMQSLED